MRRKLLKALPFWAALLLLFSSSTAQQNKPATITTIPRAYRQIKLFDQSVYQTAKELSAPYQTTGTVVAAVLPHHATASIRIASLFKTISSGSYDTVIVIAPNHSAQRGAVVTSDCDWLTPFGLLKNDDDFSKILAFSGGLGAINAPEVMETDHSASYLFSFIRDYLKDVRIAPILLARTADKAQVEALSKAVFEYAQGKRVLVLGSVDFSHYLMPDEAAKRDTETIKAVQDGAEDTLFSMPNSNLDSPQTLVTVMEYAKKRGIAPLTLLDHSSSDRELGMPPGAVNPKEGTTTYLLYAAVQKKP